MGLLFPRAFALAERLWSNPVAGKMENPDLWVSALKRLRVLSDTNMQSKCMTVQAIQPMLCNLHPEYCDEFSEYAGKYPPPPR